MRDDMLQLGLEALSEIVEKKATCPFVGTAVGMARLPVRNEATNPLASIEDLRRLGNTGGGDLGDLLVLFATGNHAFMGQLSVPPERFCGGDGQPPEPVNCQCLPNAFGFEPYNRR